MDCWITFLTKAHELKHGGIPDALTGDRDILKAIEAVDRMFDKEERQIYETRMQSLADVESKIASAEEKGLAQGMEKGMGRSLLKVLTAKFGEVPDAVKEQVKRGGLRAAGAVDGQGGCRRKFERAFCLLMQ